MKKIGVIIPTFSIEYAYDYLCGIYDFFKDKDVQAIIAQTKLPHSTTTIYEYQYWSAIDILKADEIDALVVATGVYCASLKQDNLTEILKGYGNKPVISAAIELDLPNTYTVLSNCQKSYLDIISHLKNEHNCKKIAFASANSTQSSEALDRYYFFKNAMVQNGLQFDEKNIFDGFFTDFGVREALKEKIHSKEEIDFDAIVCANDMMAVGCYNFFRELGVKVPEDVKVIGFDDSQVASYSNPKLSTINQDIYRQGYTCAECAWKVVNGENVDRLIYTDLQPKFRQSCGCIELTNGESIYKDVSLTVRKEDTEKNSRMNKYISDLEEKNNIITLMDMLKGANTLRQFYYNLKFVTGQIGMSEMSLNLYEEPLFLDSNEDFVLPKKVELYMLSDREVEETVFRPDIFFDPHKILFPAVKSNGKVIGNAAGVYVLYPIFSGESNYGFLTGKVNTTKFADYNVFLKIIVNSIAQAYEYTDKITEAEKLENENNLLIENNSNLNIQNKTDELTGILNRRGFFEFGQRTLDLVQEMNSAGIIFFADMDGLKKINDTYGHEMGDKAIKIQGEVLKNAFRSNDIVGRLSGDEFGVVAPGMLIAQVPAMRTKINNLCEKLSKKNNLPFVLSISMGCIELETSTSLKKLMTEADKNLYKEKRLKHAARDK